MNAAGLTFVLSGVVAALKMPFYESIVTDGSVSKDEFEGTVSDLSAVLQTLRKTPRAKIEAMVDMYNAELTQHLSKFNSEWNDDLLAGFRDAQIMAGYISSIMAKSGLRE